MNALQIPAGQTVLEYVRERLDGYKGQWGVISRDTGLPHDTIAKVAQGRRPNPELATIQPILDWFAARDAMLEQLQRPVS